MLLLRMEPEVDELLLDEVDDIGIVAIAGKKVVVDDDDKCCCCCW